MFVAGKRFFYGITLVLALVVIWGCQSPTNSSPDVWDVTINPTGHGEITADIERAEQGALVTLTVSAEAGYVLKSLMVTDAGGGAVSLSYTGDVYTFTMPHAGVTVDGVFEVLAAGHSPITIPTFTNGSVSGDLATAAAGTAVTLIYDFLPIIFWNIISNKYSIRL
jgi:hypothetical protein